MTVMARKELHVAPMLDVSTDEFRHFLRILTRRTVLWTEMVVDETLRHTPFPARHVGFDPVLKPLVCQLGGGRNPATLRAAARLTVEFGYEEINLNVDCPSTRVAGPSGQGGFGLVLLAEPDVAEAAVASVRKKGEEGDVNENDGGVPRMFPPLSVKTRIGVVEGKDFHYGQQQRPHEHEHNGTCEDEHKRLGEVEVEHEDEDEHDREKSYEYEYEYLKDFIDRMRRSGGCRRFYIHCRKGVLGGLLSPAQNRCVPPLDYPRVYRLCRDFPDCEFVLNGGIRTLEEAKRICDGYGSLCPSTSTSTSARDYWDAPARDGRGHGVPCSLCSHPNGSCTAPPYESPPNLVGCMLGRTAREDPAVFADADRYFYGERTNPCRTRREALVLYCAYLDRTYPRRCGDDRDDVVTVRKPAPVVERVAGRRCNVCGAGEGDEPMPTTTTTANATANATTNATTNTLTVRAKISSCVVDRSVRPVMNIFHGLPKSKAFRRTLAALSRDPSVRNCGPAFIVKTAMDTMPASVLDQGFV